MEPLTRIPPPGWPKAVIASDGVIYRISSSRRRWFNERGYFGRNRGVYYAPNAQPMRGYRYRYFTLQVAQNMIAPEALPKWLRVSEGL